jgi:hypothetical protein
MDEPKALWKTPVLRLGWFSQKTMHVLLYLKPSAILIALIVSTFLVMAFFRGRRVPQCSSCGAMKARPSLPSGLLEASAGILFIRPYRCGGCRERYYVLRVANPRKNPHAVQPSHTARALKVVLKIRHGMPIRLAISLKHA